MIELGLFVAGAGITFLWIRVERLGTQLHEIQRALESVCSQLGVSVQPSASPSDEVKSLAADPRNFVDAIKGYREESGSDLRTAKRVVEEIRDAGGDRRA